MARIPMSHFLFCCSLFCAACSGSGPGAERDDAGGGRGADGAVSTGGSRDGGQSDAESGPDGGSSGTEPSLRVTLQANDVELCPGECAVLTAAVEGDRGEVDLAWDHDLGDGREHEVCPDETTTYAIEATDTLSAVEFEQQVQDRDQLTLSVVSCDPESPVLCEARYRSNFPGGDLLRSDEPWMTSMATSSSLARGPDGSMYLMGAFGNRLDLGADVLGAESGMHGFVHKLNAQCEPVWTRRLDPSATQDSMLPSALVSDTDGNVYAVATSGPLVDFDPLLPMPFRFVTELVIYKLSPSGEELYRSTIPMSFGGGVHGAEVDGEGRLWMSGFAHALTNFGGGTLGLSPTTFHSFLLGVDERGKHHTTETNAGAYRFARAQDSLIFISNSLEQVDLLASLLGFFSHGGEEPRLVSRSLPGLEERWQSAFTENHWPNVVGGYPDGSAITVANDTEVESGETETTFSSAVSVVRYDASGNASPPVEALEMTEIQANDESNGWRPPHVHHLDTSSQGLAAAVAGYYYGTVTLDDGSVLEPSTEADETDTDGSFFLAPADLFVAKIGDDDAALWVRRVDVGEDPSAVGLVMDADGHPWVAAQGRVRGAQVGSNGEVEQDLVVVKLRSGP